MANVTKDGNHTTTIQGLFCTTRLGIHQKIFISAFNIPLSITAFLGNVLIIVALQKVSSLHPPSKLLYGCLASTDLCVGLISQPLYISYLMSPQHIKSCYYLRVLLNTIGTVFCGVSLLTLTAVSVDRLLALLLGLRYRQVVTLRRAWVLVVTCWLFSTFFVGIVFYNFRIATGIACTVLLLCVVSTTVCYTKIYLKLHHHQAQVQDHVHQGQPNGEGTALNIARYRKTVSSALWVQMTLLACYLPFGIVVAIFTITGPNTPFIDLAWSVTLSLFLFNSTLNPFLYCWKMREVRQAVKDTIRQLSCCFSS